MLVISNSDAMENPYSKSGTISLSNSVNQLEGCREHKRNPLFGPFLVSYSHARKLRGQTYSAQLRLLLKSITSASVTFGARPASQRT